MTRRETGVGFTKLTTYIWPDTRAYTYDTLTMFAPVPTYQPNVGQLVGLDATPPEPCPAEYLSGDEVWQPPDKSAAWKFNKTTTKWVLVWGVTADRGRDVTTRSKS